MYKRTWAGLLLIGLGSLVLPLLLEGAAAPEGEKKKPDPKGDLKGKMVFKGPMGSPGQVRKLVKQFDKDGDGRLNKEERQAARAFLQKQRKGGGPGGFPGGGFNPVSSLAKSLREALDTDKDGKVSSEELTAGVKKFFADCDKDNKGALTEAQLAEGLKRIIPQPPMPGGGPPGVFKPFPGGPPGGPLTPPGVPPGMPFGPPFGAARPGQILPGPLAERLNLTDEQKKQLEKLQKEVDERLAKILTDEQKKRLPQGMPPFGPPGVPGGPPGGAFPGPPGRPGGPAVRVFGLDRMLAGNIVRRADKNKDGKVTLDELLTVANALFKDADKNKDGKLDEKELGAAVGQLFAPPPGFGPPGGFPTGKTRAPGKPGPRVTPADVKTYPKAPLYEPTVLRTLFLEFEDKDWEAELADFYKTDILVPATLTVDGKKYPNVGVHFRGMSSFFAVQAGSKRSLNLTLDFVDKKQRLYGYKTLNLLNSHDDPSLMHTVLFSHIARHFIPAPKANFVKVVINGESWGVYVNAQQFNKDFLADHFKTRKGARWKVTVGGGPLDYLGENVADYKRRYLIKSKDDEKDWKALVELCRTLNKTPPDKLEEALKPILDIDGALWFLALDNAVINGDGYWTRASDYSLYRDPKGKFHVLPHDINETFQPMMGGPMMMGPGGGKLPPKGGLAVAKGPASGYALDPLIGLDDPRKPLRSRLLAVPRLRQRYLEHMRTIAEVWFDWKKLGPVVAQYRTLIEKEVEQDTRKLYTLENFRSALADEPPKAGGRLNFNLRAFVEGRRNYLLNYPAIRQLGERPAAEAKSGAGQ